MSEWVRAGARNKNVFWFDLHLGILLFNDTRQEIDHALYSLASWDALLYLKRYNIISVFELHPVMRSSRVD